MLRKNINLIISIFCQIFLVCLLSSCSHNTGRPTSENDISKVIGKCKREYRIARDLQLSQRYDEAIETYKVCINFDSTNKETCDSLSPMVIDAMLQMMNCYQSKGEPETCINYLYKLQENPTSLIQKYCLRDLYSITGYALSRTERMDDAEMMTYKALNSAKCNYTPERLFRDYAYSAAVFYPNPNKQEQVVRFCIKALEQGKLCEKSSGAQWIKSMLGTIYKKTGRINEAVSLILQGVNEAREKKDYLGESNACNSLTELYLYWNLPEYANIYADMSILSCMRSKDDNPMMYGLAYMFKGKVMMMMEIPDSAIYYLQKADRYTIKLPYNSCQAGVDCLLGATLAGSHRPELHAKGIERLQRASKLSTSGNKAIASYELARVYSKTGDIMECEAMLDSMYTHLNSSSSPTYIDGAYCFALDHYLQSHNSSKVYRYAGALLEESKFKLSNKTSKKLAETIVKFQTEKKQQQLLLKQSEAENSQLYLNIYIIITISISVILILFAIYKRNNYKLRQQMLEQRLSSLLNQLESIHNEKGEVDKRLSELTSKKEERYMVEPVNPKMLHEGGEPKFRQRFETLYPGFIPALREKVPGIGRKEELLCMLIVLGQDTFQIEQIMSIAHSSVIMARYRLRQKFGLEKNQSLEDAVKSLL